ncbi:DNA helicase UvrD, partial [Aquimarina celericrescens]|nr:DNA helicase UvrD [Aquimarina celericrescens]
KKNHGYQVANFLNENGIPIISTETLLVKNSEEVRFLVAILQFSLNPSDKNLKFEILDYLFQSKKESDDYFHTIYDRLQKDHQEFFESLTEFDYFFNLNVLQRSTLYESVEYIIRSFHLEQKADAYLQFFLDFVYEFAQKNIGNIAGFIDHWELNKDKLSVIAPEGEDAVQIMTIHTSKGLEFPI